MTRPILMVLLVTTGTAIRAAQPITDEALKRQVLKATFPQMKVSVVPGLRIDKSWSPKEQIAALSFPDALAGDTVYQVVGPPSLSEEDCAASNVIDPETFGRARELRFRVYRWPGVVGANEILAVLQYAFADANPPGSCTSIARLLHLKISNGTWKVIVDIALDTTHHTAIQSIREIDLTGNGLEQLVLESDEGGAGVHVSDLIVFSLAMGRFDQWLSVPSRKIGWIDGEDRQFVQLLDVQRTTAKKGTQFCFKKTTFAIKDLWLSKPQVTNPCYSRFTEQ